MERGRRRALPRKEDPCVGGRLYGVRRTSGVGGSCRFGMSPFPARAPLAAGACGARRADGGAERGRVVLALVPPSVDEERRRAGDAREVGALDVARDATCVGAPPQAVPEPLLVEAQLLRVVAEVGRAQLLLMRDEEVVHVPEAALLARGLGCLGGE